MAPEETVKPMEKTEVVAKSMEIIEKGTPLLKDEDQAAYFTGTLKGLKTADEMVNNLEKATRMQDAAVKFANQICFILFREDTITDELRDMLRSLPTPEDTTKLVKEFTDEREGRIKALNDAHSAIMDEQRELDIFLGVIAGMSPEEAARRMKEHDDQVKAQLNKQG